MDNVIVAGVCGGRENAIVDVLCQSDAVGQVYVNTPNPGALALGAKDLGVGADDYPAVVQAAKRLRAFVVIGPELPLVEGLADMLRAEGVAVFGPGAEAAALEGSKAYATEFMRKHDIPQPDAHLITSLAGGKQLLATTGDAKSWVLKVDGLAGGKGVTLPDTPVDFMSDLETMLEGGKKVVIQERLSGPELSVFAVSDGKSFVVVPYFDQDHKRLKDGDKGLNTGGMGAYGPVPDSIVAAWQRDKLYEIAEKVIKGSQADGKPYVGVLYIGAILAKERGGNPVVIEFNCRWGDPEAEVLLPMIQGSGIDVYSDLLRPAAEGSLRPEKIRWQTSDTAALTVCLAAEGYPKSPVKGAVIHGLDTQYSGAKIYHGSTKRLDSGEVVADGGRILYVTGYGKTIDEAAKNAYAAIGKDGVHFAGMQYRKDIGYQARKQEI